MGGAPQRPGPDGRGPLVPGEGPGEPAAPGGQMAVQLEEEREGGRQAEERFVAAGGVGPFHGGPEVVVVPFEAV